MQNITILKLIQIYIIDGQDRIKLTVTNIISSPETIGVGSYIGSWYDMRDYGFIYVSSDLKEEVFKTSELCNVYKILVDDDANIDKIEERIKEIISEDYLISISRYEDSSIKTQLDSSIDTVKSITSYLPLIVIILGVLFSLLFIYQVTRKSRKDIALLRAIGYSKTRVQWFF